MNTASDKLFKALSDPTRRALYELVAREGAQTVHALTDRSGVSQPAVSKHLGLLKRAGLVTDQRFGRETRYSVKPDGLTPLIDWMKVYAPFWNERIDQLEQLLDRME